MGKSYGPFPSSLPSIYARFQRGFHRFELAVDGVRRLELMNFVFEAADSKRLGAAFGKIGAALEQLELGKGVERPAAVHNLVRPRAIDGAFEPGGDRVLASA